jgi:hypothetical protein
MGPPPPIGIAAAAGFDGGIAAVESVVGVERPDAA